MRVDPVTPELRLAVIARDGSCIAPILGGSFMECWGRTTIEHVKDALRMGKRAPSDLAHMVALCQGHTEDGRRAGYQWNTDKSNRARVRAYLERVQEHVHVEPVPGCGDCYGVFG